MLTWQNFFESKEKESKKLEKEEERLHKDLDGDNEEGESKEHKEKVFGKTKEKKRPTIEIRTFRFAQRLFPADLK